MFFGRGFSSSLLVCRYFHLEFVNLTIRDSSTPRYTQKAPITSPTLRWNPIIPLPSVRTWFRRMKGSFASFPKPQRILERDAFQKKRVYSHSPWRASMRFSNLFIVTLFPVYPTRQRGYHSLALWRFISQQEENCIQLATCYWSK